MNRERGALGVNLRIAFAAAATTWAAMLSWRGFTVKSSEFLMTLILVGTIIAVVGALGRWRRLPGVVVLLGQLVAGSVAVTHYSSGSFYPDPAFWDSLRGSLDAAQLYASPVPSTTEITVQPLLVVGGFAAMLFVDLLACTLRRVPLAGLPLLTVYSVPISLLDRGLSWWVFGGTALGFLLMLFLQEQEHVGRWGRSLDPSSAPVRRSEAVRASALFVSSFAVAVAIVAPLAVPTVDLAFFDFGSGGGGGGDEIKIVNPMLDLRRDLRRGEDVDLVTITTDDPAPDHLRISVLNRFSNNEFSSGDRDVPSANVADGPLPALQGVNASVLASKKTYAYQVDVDPAFTSRWLPTQAPISDIDAPGDWRFDTSTMDFLASDSDLTTAGISYSMTAVDYDFPPSAVSNSTALGDVSEEVLALPDNLDPIVAKYANEATAGALTKYDEAVALQQWFREDGGFRYSLEDAPQGEVGTDELVAFLDPNSDTGRVGYCEQFAAAMAVMARELRIPSRVAVGFLKPDQVGPDTWVYSAHDLHAWPELYFEGVGWVLFDPTPGDRVLDSELPAYTTRGSDTQLPTVSPSDDTSKSPSARPSDRNQDRPTTPPKTSASDNGAGDGSSIPWILVLGVLVGLLLLAALVLAPRTLRTRQQVRRLARGPESAWEELRATVVDLGQTWPESRSPQEVESALADRFGSPEDHDERPAHGPDRNPEAVQALVRITRQVERARYSRAAGTGEAGMLHDDVRTCAAALAAGASPRARRRATWLPRSVFQRRPALDEQLPEPESDLVGSVVEHI